MYRYHDNGNGFRRPSLFRRFIGVLQRFIGVLQQLIDFLKQVLFGVVFTGAMLILALLSIVIYFLWNRCFVATFPIFPHVTYLNALGILFMLKFGKSFVG